MIVGLFIFFIELGFGLNLGPLPVSEWILYVFFILKFNDFKRIFIDGELKFFFKIFFLFLIIQLFSDIIHQPGYFFILKGSDSIIMGVLHVFFLYYYLRKNPKLLVFALIGACFTTLYSSQRFMGMENSNYSDVLDSEDAPIMKFIVAPIMSYGVCIVSFLTKKNRWLVIAIIVLAIFFVLAGARSSGLLFVLTVFFIFISLTKFINNKRLQLIVITLLVVGYGGYSIYVSNVLNGNIVSGNNEQILELDDPYNPAALLIYGRPEVYVEAKALAESPLIGYSSHPIDVGGKYRALRAKIKNVSMISYKKGANIPGHSVIFDMGLFYGIFALLLMLYFTLKILKFGIFCLPYSNNIIMLSYSLSFILWNSFFSPIGHLKWSLPLFYVVIFLNIQSRSRQVKSKKINISSKNNCFN